MGGALLVSVYSLFFLGCGFPLTEKIAWLLTGLSLHWLRRIRSGYRVCAEESSMVEIFKAVCSLLSYF